MMAPLQMRGRVGSSLHSRRYKSANLANQFADHSGESGPKYCSALRSSHWLRGTAICAVSGCDARQPRHLPRLDPRGVLHDANQLQQVSIDATRVNWRSNHNGVRYRAWRDLVDEHDAGERAEAERLHHQQHTHGEGCVRLCWAVRHAAIKHCKHDHIDHGYAVGSVTHGDRDRCGRGAAQTPARCRTRTVC